MEAKQKTLVLLSGRSPDGVPASLTHLSKALSPFPKANKTPN